MGLSVETLVLAKKYTDEQIKNSGESVDLSALKEYIDLPFEESFSDTLTLDGDSTGLILYSSYYKVLDIEITEEDLIKGGSYSLFNPSNETIQEWTFTENDITPYLENSSILSIKGGTIIVVIEDNNFLGVNFTKGIYIDKLFYGETALTSYVISLTINGFNKFSSRVLKDSYLPDVPSPIQPDWNQNDESAPDYIKNKPFYSTGEYSYIEILNTSAIGKLGAFYFIPDTNIVLEEGQNYQIIINKTNEYFCTGYKDANGYISLGEIDIDSFSIQSAGDMIFIDVQDGLTITNLQINKAVEQIQYLDKKYVANFIAGEKTVNQEVQYKEKTYICKEGAEKFNIGNIAIGLNSHAEGSNSVALGANSHAEGSHTEALGENSHAEGGYTQALSFYSHAEGGHTIASGNCAHAEGSHTQALNFFSHAEGEHTIANAIFLHVQGRYNIPDDAPAYSRTWTIWTDYPKYDGDKVIYIFNDEPIFNANEGTSTIVTMPYQSSIKDLKKNDYFVFSYPESEIIDTYYCATELVSQETNSEGKTLYKWKYSGASYSSNLNEGTYLHIVGNGDYVYDEDLKTHVEKRSNAHTLDWDGNAWFSGDVYVGSTSGVNYDEGSKKLATEDFVNEQVNNLIIVSEEEPEDGTLWIDKDANEEIILAEIDDNEINKEKTWSSSKIKNEFDAVEEKLGGTVEITSDNPYKANTVMTIDPSADEINVYSVEEVDAITDELADKADDMQRQINVERARINTFTALGEGSTTGDAELADARIDKDGTTHANVGEHIRTVTQGLFQDIDKVTDSTKNFFDPKHLLLATGWAMDSDGSFYGTLSSIHKKYGSTKYPFDFIFEEGQDYVISFEAKMSGDLTTGDGLQVKFQNVGESNTIGVIVPNSTSEYTKFELATYGNGKTLDGVYFTYGSGGNNIVHIRNIQFEKGRISTNYVQHLSAKDINARNDIEMIFNEFENYADYYDIMQSVNGKLKIDWVACDVEISTTGWKVYDKTIGTDARRIAPKEGTSLHLRKGDVIGMTDYTDFRFYVGGYSDGKYFTKSWNTSDYVVPSDGDYCVLIAHIDNRLISSVEELSSKFFCNAQCLLSDVEELKKYSGTIPLYWKTYLSEKIEQINNTIDTIGINGDNFVFFTDYHIEHNAGYSPLIINEIVNNTSINKVFYGGDTFNGNASKDVVLEYMRKFASQFNKLNFYGVRGNHDNNTADGGSTSVSLTDNQIYNYLVKKSEDTITSFDGLNYYVDNKVSKIRYICLNTAGATTGTVLSDGLINWIKTSITELQSGWSVLVISHGLFNFVSTKEVVTTDPGYWNFGQQIVTALNDIYDSANANIIGILCGHGHYDFVKNETKGYLCIATTCDTRQEQGGIDRTLGTTNEHAFDVVSIDTTNRTVKTIRIGSGLDRTMTY